MSVHKVETKMLKIKPIPFDVDFYNDSNGLNYVCILEIERDMTQKLRQHVRRGNGVQLRRAAVSPSWGLTKSSAEIIIVPKINIVRSRLLGRPQSFRSAPKWYE